MTVAQLRPVVAKVNLNALRHNITVIKQQLKPHQQFYAVVKANAYGHGLDVIAQTAQENGVDGFCVALLDEAIFLRKKGITLPILVLGLTQPQYVPLAIKYDVMLTISTLSFLKDCEPLISDIPLKIHVAIDTGMSRIGIKSKSELLALEQWLVTHKDKFVFDGLFTHFATADGENDNFVQKQYDRFQQLMSQLHHDVPHIHLANSAMTLWRNQYDSDIVRVGIAMYGLNPSDFTLDLPYALQPVLSLETEVVYEHLLKKGESVSYGAKYIAKQDERVGTLPIGYADGWKREYAPLGVYINGQKCDVLGVICMDQMMIRLPENASVGTKVELIGHFQSASDVAVSVGTIGYEVLCGISERVKREYIN